MKLNKYPYRIKIDEEIKNYIYFLNKNKINSAKIIRNSMKESLKNKCIEFKFKQKQIKYPF